nr:hypothetical protein [Methanobrevibacter arboriphilus]
MKKSSIAPALLVAVLLIKFELVIVKLFLPLILQAPPKFALLLIKLELVILDPSNDPYLS